MPRGGKHKAARRGQRATTPKPRSSAPRSTAQTELLELQATAGNQAATQLIEDPAGSSEATNSPGGGAKRKRRRRRKAAPTDGTASTAAATPPLPGATGQQPDEVESAPDDSWSAWLGGAMTSALEMIKPAAVNSGDDMDGVSGHKSEQTRGDFGDEHDEPIDKADLFGTPEISITLHKQQLQGELGDAVSGGYEIKRLLDGYEGTAQFEVKSGTEATRSLGKVSFLGGMLQAEFSNEQFLGDKFGGKALGTLTSGKAAARGELTAFQGYEEKTTGKVTLNVGERQIASFEGGAGFTIGHGGEAKGHVTFADGKLSMGSKGSLSYGYGTTWEYKLEIDSPAVAHGLWSWASSWGSWLSGVASGIDEAFTDEDGELINLGL